MPSLSRRNPSGEPEYGTAPVKESARHADGLVDADLTAFYIGSFFRSLGGFIKAENEVYKIINS